MDKTRNNHTNNYFLKRFSINDGNSDGVAVNSENDNNLAVSAENEQNVNNNATDVRNTSVDAEKELAVTSEPQKEKSQKTDPKTIWSFWDVDDQFQFDLKGIKNTARELYTAQLLESWDRQACELSEKYPDFDIRREVKNKTFLALLRCGISLDLAYKAMNYDNILRSEINKALDLAYADIRARGARPAENGLISCGGINIGLGARSFSRKERAEIARRVENGEKIIL